MRFAKGHGTENDFVILPDPEGQLELSAGLVARLCDRRAGIGGDGVLRVVRTEVAIQAGSGPEGPLPGPADGAGPGGAGLGGDGLGGRDLAGEPLPEWFMDYRNADGSLAEMCGNGLRVFARYLASHGLVTGPSFSVATRGGSRWVRLAGDGGVAADLGPARVLGPGQAVVGGKVCSGLRVSVGNPHLACLVDGSLAGYDLTRPPELDPAVFPDGGNTELVRVTGPGAVQMRVYERGSGETRSCGTGAVAAAAAAAYAAGQEQGSWQVSVPGGQLGVELADGRSWLSGPAVIVAEGELGPGWLALALARPAIPSPPAASPSAASPGGASPATASPAAAS
jgi:diaminopimelate epimerase